MKYKLTVIVVYIVLQCSAATAGTRFEDNAQKLVSQYLAALVRGDTNLLLDIIGGDLLESRRKLLQNPSYSNYLTQIYSDASVSVTGSRQLTDSRVEVDAVINKITSERFNFIFLVEADDKSETLRIISERDAKE